MISSYIFSLGLIPVQEFISEARRSRDLWAGSMILSRLMRQIIFYLDKDAQVTLNLIIPHKKILAEATETLGSPGKKYSIPNRASGYITGTEIEALFNKLADDCLLTEWQKLFKENFENATYPKDKMGEIKKYIEEEFFNSSYCPFQIIWVLKKDSNPADQSVSKRQQDMKTINRLYTNIKRTRPVEHWAGSNVGKCDQCGTREAIGPKDNITAWRTWHRELQEKQWVQKGERIEPGERLCIVCITKRFTAYQPGMESFPSTSAIAARVWQRVLQESKTPEILSCYGSFESLLKSSELGETDNLIYTRSIYKKLHSKPDTQEKKILSSVLKARKRLSESIQATPLLNLKTEPSNYLAVLTFDGDKMGQKVIQYIETLPERLFEFSKALYSLCSNNASFNSAEPFYIGGDEGLLLAPIDNIIDLAFGINELFTEKTRNIGDDITLSFGIAIFDRERPLGGAITLAHQAVKEAKSLSGRNGLSLFIQTASGNEFSTTAPLKGNTWKRILHAIKLLNAAESEIQLSRAWTYEVEHFLQTLPGHEWGRPNFRSAVASEVKRITLRKISVSGSSETDTQQAQSKIWDEILGVDSWFNVGQYDKAVIETLSNQLHTIAFLARESSFYGPVAEQNLQGAE